MSLGAVFKRYLETSDPFMKVFKNTCKMHVHFKSCVRYFGSTILNFCNSKIRFMIGDPETFLIDLNGIFQHS